MAGLEEIVNDDFSNIVPPFLRKEGVDTGLINMLVRSADDETFKGLYRSMNPETEAAFYKTIAWYEKVNRREKYGKLRLKLYVQLEASRRKAKELFPNGMAAAVNDAYISYLLQLGLPKEKITSWIKFLLWSDITLTRIFKHGIDDVKPNGFGPYAVIGYPTRIAIRYFMLEGATKG